MPDAQPTMDEEQIEIWQAEVLGGRYKVHSGGRAIREVHYPLRMVCQQCDRVFTWAPRRSGARSSRRA